MKKILCILVFVPFGLFGQGFLAIEQDIPLELIEGWNMFGFNCVEPINISEAFVPINDKIIIAKDGVGNVYLPDWDFNGIGDLVYNGGYQIKLTDGVSDFQFCPTIVPLVAGCMDEMALNYNSTTNVDDGSCIDVIVGCMESDAFNYDSLANTSAECIDIIFGCTDSTACNYWWQANVDDGSCEYAEEGVECSLQITTENIHQMVANWISNPDAVEATYGHIADWDVSNVTNMNRLFEGTGFSGDLSNWDVSNVTDMRGMFANLISFTSDLSSWDVSNVTDMLQMFLGCMSFTSDLSSWDVSNVTNMHQMFSSSGITAEDQCSTQETFLWNPNWPYDWECE